jgi:hypothetical protein
MRWQDNPRPCKRRKCVSNSFAQRLINFLSNFVRENFQLVILRQSETFEQKLEAKKKKKFCNQLIQKEKLTFVAHELFEIQSLCSSFECWTNGHDLRQR